MKQSTRTPVRAPRQRLVPQVGSRRPCASAPWRGREGAAPLGIVFWMVALALFVLPFLQAPAAPDWDAEDPNRNEETDYPYADDVASFDEYAIEEDLGLEGTLAETIATQSEELYGPGSDRLRDSGLVDVTRLASGRKEYELHCAGCHSMIGDGAGPAARYLHPRPRNFRKGIYKFKSTSSGERPVRTDLFQTITRGLAGSAMPEFRLLPEEKRWDLVEYVVYLSLRGEFEEKMVYFAWEDDEIPDATEMSEIVDTAWSTERLRPQYPNVAEPARDQASIDRGRELFIGQKAACYTCHGNGGRGDGPSADEYTDDWGYPIRPRDLTAGVFRAGATGKDLWLTIANGIGGSPMPSYAGALTGEEMWDLVHFVEYLASDENQEN